MYQLFSFLLVTKSIDVDNDLKIIILEPFELPQANGQLMGSITSFPILCVVNAAICRFALEHDYAKQLQLKQCRLAINGDDGLLKIGQLGKELWESAASFVGLAPSIGKVYYSDRYLNINSTSYLYHPEGYECLLLPSGRPNKPFKEYVSHFQLGEYVNMRLLFGMTRSAGAADIVDTTSERPVGIGERCTQLINSTPYCLRKATLCQFLHINKEVLQRFNIPWFIPTAFKGLGLPTFECYSPSNRELRLARMLFEHPDVFPAPPPLPKFGEWRTWKEASTRIEKLIPKPVMVNDFTGFVGRDEHDEIYQLSHNQLTGLASIALLFDRSIEKYADMVNPSAKEAITSVTGDVVTLQLDGRKIRTQVKGKQKSVDKIERQIIWDYYRRLHKLWARARVSTIPYPEPFSLDNLPMIVDSLDQPTYHRVTKAANVHLWTSHTEYDYVLRVYNNTEA